MTLPCSTSTGSGLTILVVDDELRVQRVLAKALEAAGFRVVTVSTGMEAIGLVRRDAPDFILLDVMMPRLDGFEVLKLLKTDPDLASIPVGMLMGMPAEVRDYSAITGRGEFFQTDQIELVVIKPLLKDPAELGEYLKGWFSRRPKPE